MAKVSSRTTLPYSTLPLTAPKAFLVGIACFASACVTPPTIKESQYLPSQELKLISTLKQGTDYAEGGRADLAEVQFRKALAMNPKLSKVHNDLGYSLQAQDRLEEAIASYHQALQLSENNIIARENLARALYLQGDIEGSIREFNRVLELYDLLPPSLVKAASGETFKPADLESIYRNLASAYYRTGQFDEAICYSKKTLQFSGVDLAVAGQHARLLLSLEMTGDTASLLRDSIAVLQTNTPAKFYLDYGIALSAQGDYTLAKEAFARGVATKDVEEADRRTLRLLLLMIDSKAAATPEERQSLVTDFLSADPQFCDSFMVDPDSYWPQSVVQEVRSFIKPLCGDSKGAENRTSDVTGQA